MKEMSFKETIEKVFTPTPEDLAKKLTESQVKELCLRRNCRVNMHYWNPVHDFVLHLKAQDRLKNKSAKNLNKLLVKGVNRFKDTHFYTDEEILSYQRECWAHTKKLNLLYLNLWEYERNSSSTNNNSNDFNNNSFNENSESPQVFKSEKNTEGLPQEMLIKSEDVDLGSEEINSEEYERNSSPVLPLEMLIDSEDVDLESDCEGDEIDL